VENGDELLRAVLASPDDSALRGVYADWLEERGDVRGEFLRTAGLLALLPHKDKRRDPLVARLQELRQVIDPAWRALVELRLPGDLVEFLAAGQPLDYDPDACEAGAVTLMPLSELIHVPGETVRLPPVSRLESSVPTGQRHRVRVSGWSGSRSRRVRCPCTNRTRITRT
jgi:uncharacterized protein (TIGR02996 family)